MTRKKKKQTGYDSWENMYTNIGTIGGKVSNTQFVADPALSEHVLASLYRSDGVSRRVVDILIEDSLRGFIEAEEELLDEFKRLKGKQRIIEATTYARLYGGSLLVAYVDDGQEMDQPLNYKRIKRVVKLCPYSKFNVTWVDEDLSTNYYDEHYGEPEHYRITPERGESFRVHRSRTFKLEGELLPEILQNSNNYWGDSTLQSIYTPLMHYNSVKSVTVEMMQDVVQKVIYIDNLVNMIAAGETEQVMTRLRHLDMNASVANATVMDMGIEKYEKHSTNLSGVSDLWGRFSENISSTTGIPYSKLFNKESGGLSDASKDETDTWHAKVDSYRADELEPLFDWLINMFTSQALWKAADRPQDFDWVFPELDIVDEQERADVKLKTAQLDQIYINSGAVSPTELYKLRYAGGVFQTDINIDELDSDDDTNDPLGENEDFGDLSDIESISNEESARDELLRKLVEKIDG